MIYNILLIVLFISVTFVSLLFLAWLYNVILYIIVNKQRVFSPKFYVKEIPFLINKGAMYKVSTAGQFLGIIILTAVVTFIFLNNTTPLGVTYNYSLNQGSEYLSTLGPKERVVEENYFGNKHFKQLDDNIYFSSTMPFPFDIATVKIIYKNQNSEQYFTIGFQDQENWHFEEKLFDVPFLNTLQWIKNGYSPVLYQRERKYNSVDDFFANPPQNEIIGTYKYDTLIGNNSDTVIEQYSPIKHETTINTSLRGKHILYAYLQNEPFRMRILKQDLNWYDGTDEMSVKIYKGLDLVYEIHAEDDGIRDNSKKVLTPQEIKIKNPRDENPESGVYRIVIDANDDTIIKRISTNLNKIVFVSTIFPVTNKSSYPSVISSTSATTIFTNALSLSAITYHNAGKQNILIGDQVLGINTLNSNVYLPPKDNISEVVIPQSDVILNGLMGYFAFSRDQFFLPTKYHVLPITKPEDVTLVDYILTDYLPARREGEWQVNEQTFDLRTAYIKDNKLSWIIKAPKLKERSGEIIIKDIQITFHKKGWL